MYVCYYQSFLLLSVPEVLVFTIFTPLYVTLIFDLLKGRFSARYLLTAALAVVGAGILRFSDTGDNFMFGFFVVQGANICFAAGQVGYKLLLERGEFDLPQRSVFGYFYLGALLVALVAWGLLGNPQKLPTSSLQWGVLLWLGLVASGLGYFLWNKGATLVDAGTLAIMNNALVPAGLVVNLLIWNRDMNLLRFGLGGGVLLLSLLLHEFWGKATTRSGNAIYGSESIRDTSLLKM
jgi:carboxylate/amino acid/amine transporter